MKVNVPVFIFAVLLCACSSSSQIEAVNTAVKPSKIKNLILMIGDGMGPQQIGLLQEYAQRAPNSIYNERQTALAQLANKGVVGLSMNGPDGALVVDSACSATQLATGQPAKSEMIGLNSLGNKVSTILEKAKALGKTTGLVSDTRITHATPASFASHQIHRSFENLIAEEMIANNKVDLLLSGGLRHFLPKNTALMPDNSELTAKLIESGLSLQSKRRDQKNILLNAQTLGYEIAFTKEQLAQTRSNKVLGLFANSALMDGIAHHHKRKDKEPSLPELTQVALDKLSHSPQGFFLMVEGGQIDWAGHNNDAGTLLHEMIKFDSTVDVVLDWAKNRDDTLIIVTADHETGGFSFSYHGEDIPQPVQLNNQNNDTFKPNFNFGDLATLDKLYLQKKTYQDMWAQARQGKKSPTLRSLVSAINENTEYQFDQQMAKAVLQKAPNTIYKQGHKTLDKNEAALIHDFSPFYVYLNERPLNLIARQLATQQGIVWSTGTHTHTPVPVFAYGPEMITKQFSGLTHHVGLGQLMQQVFLKQ